jgi:hypothetical protein
MGKAEVENAPYETPVILSAAKDLRGSKRFQILRFAQDDKTTVGMALGSTPCSFHSL